MMEESTGPWTMQALLHSFIGSAMKSSTSEEDGALIEWSATTLLTTLVLMMASLYIAAEVAFWFHYYYYLIPVANQRTQPAPYRDYGPHRHLLVRRVAHAIMGVAEAEQQQQQGKVDPIQVLERSFLAWFEPVVNEPNNMSSLENNNNNAASTTTKNARLLRFGLVESFVSSFASDDENSEKEEDTNDDETESQSSSSSNMSSHVEDADSTTPNESFSSSNNSAPKEPTTTKQEEDSLFATTTTTTTDHNNHNDDERITIPHLGRTDIEGFLAWALFGKDLSDLKPWERHEMIKSVAELEQGCRVSFCEGSTGQYRPRRLSLEDVTACYRPLAVYLFVFGLKCLAGLWLRLAGFQRVVANHTSSDSGGGARLVGWYRPAYCTATKSSSPPPPLLFFHGIAPAGLLGYIPLVLRGLANDGRAIIMFENPNIACRYGFDVLSEPDTVQGVVEICDRCSIDKNVVLCGHSFGSCPMTWLSRAPQFRHRILQLILLDPVTIALSEPDVALNFLYDTSLTSRRIVASSELFIQYYLRRHFCYYNCELWFNSDVNQTNMIIALSGQDDIVPTTKVRQYVQVFGNAVRHKLLYWPDGKHGANILMPSRWQEIRQAMLQQQEQ